MQDGLSDLAAFAGSLCDLKYSGETDNCETQIFGHADCNHVPLDELTNLYTCVVFPGYQIDRIIRRRDLQDDFRIGACEPGQALGRSTIYAAVRGMISRIRPAGRSLCFRASATDLSIRSRAGARSWRSAVPAAVGETLRVVRASSCSPNLFSRPRMEWLRADCEMPSRAAARVKLRSSATTANAESSPRSFLMIHEFYS